MLSLYSPSQFKMKYNRNVSSSRSKARKAHFNSNQEDRRKIMSAGLSKELRKKYNVRSLPIRKDDEVRIVRGSFKARDGKVVAVSRNSFVIHVERIQREKQNGQTKPIGIPPSNCIITTIHLDRDRRRLLERKNRSNNSGKVSNTDAGLD
jgi:large subunit ribosomal protein L26e